MNKLILFLFFSLLPMVANADAVEIDGIYYNLVNKAKVAEVTSNPNNYSGELIIPDKVIFESIEYSVTSIGDWAFAEDTSLSSITIPNSVTSIGLYVCFGCTGLSSVTIPNSVTSIGKGIFFGCTNLNYLPIPNSVNSIVEEAFMGCTSLISVTIPNNIISIGNSAFNGCTGLSSVTIPSSVTSIGDKAFLLCTDLSSITIPNSVNSIGMDAFGGCTNLKYLPIPNSLTSISQACFAGCDGLVSITIPNGITSIGVHAFASCGGLTSVTIPNSVTSIEYHAFGDCNSLTTVTIGNSVTSIASNTFANCPNIEDVFCLAEDVPNTNTDAFEGSYIEYATLHVPKGSVDAYEAIEPWRNFGRIIDYDEVNVSASKIRTYSSPFDLDLTNVSGLSAYVISNFDATEGTLTLTPVTTVKAGEGLLLKGDAGDYEIPYTTTDATYTNYLVGVPFTTTVSPTDGEYTNFILADGSHGVNFYALSKTGDISGGKAYLQLPTAALDGANTSRGFSFEDDESTAIKQINVEYKDTTIYDLQGRRVIRPSKGLYIVNGKKVIIM